MTPAELSELMQIIHFIHSIFFRVFRTVGRMAIFGLGLIGKGIIVAARALRLLQATAVAGFPLLLPILGIGAVAGLALLAKESWDSYHKNSSSAEDSDEENSMENSSEPESTSEQSYISSMLPGFLPGFSAIRNMAGSLESAPYEHVSSLITRARKSLGL